MGMGRRRRVVAWAPLSTLEMTLATPLIPLLWLLNEVTQVRAMAALACVATKAAMRGAASPVRP